MPKVPLVLTKPRLRRRPTLFIHVISIYLFVMLSSDKIASKEQLANQVMWQLHQVLDQISRKTILDIGFGFGFNAAAMSARYFGTVKEKFFPGTWNRCLLICTNPNR
jgi:hypothetical protein